MLGKEEGEVKARSEKKSLPEALQLGAFSRAIFLGGQASYLQAKHRPVASSDILPRTQQILGLVRKKGSRV